VTVLAAFTVSVYALVKDGDVIYVGQTKDPKTRERRHRREREFDDYVILAEGLDPHHESIGVERAFSELHGLEVGPSMGWHPLSGTSGGSSRSELAIETKRQSMTAWNEAHPEDLRDRARQLGLKHGPVSVITMRKALTTDVLSAAGKKGGPVGGKKVSSMRRRCTCGRVMPPGSLGRHQKSAGHVGWENA